jgi:hypothetical protein
MLVGTPLIMVSSTGAPSANRTRAVPADAGGMLLDDDPLQPHIHTRIAATVRHRL